jgi:cobalt-zinc-cadmium efflux system protein
MSVREPGRHPGHLGQSHLHAPPDGDRGRLAVALSLIVGFMLVEVVAGALAHSLALLSDAAHMVTDAGALALSLVVIALAARPAKGAMTYGFRRAEILSAQFNGSTLLVLALLISYEGIRRLIEPPDVHGTAVLAVALAGIAVNLAATRVLARAGRASMNIEGAYRHLVTDLAAFALTAIAGIVILTTGFRRADGIASLVIAATMIAASYGLLRDSGRVFLEAAPRGLDPEVIGFAMAGMADVSEVHDLHVWQVGSGFPSLSAHVLVASAVDCHAARRAIETLLHERFSIFHTTLQVEHEHGELITIESAHVIGGPTGVGEAHGDTSPRALGAR